MNKTITKYLFIFGLISSIYIVKEFNFIFYNSTDSPDFDTYSVYFEYFFNSREFTGREQGLLYYYLNSWMYYLLNLNSEFSNNYFLLHKSVQSVNFYLFIIGLTGVYKLLKLFNFQEKIIYLTLITINLLPMTVALRLVFKPEILTFAFLPWIYYCFEFYKESKNYKYILFSVPLISSLITSKGSIAIMLIVSLIFLYIGQILNFKLKIFFIIAFVFIILTVFVVQEDTMSNGLRIDQLESGASSNPEYDFKAPRNFLYKINLYQLVSSPVKHRHASSFIGITLLDTFGDYFDIYWDNDSSIYFKNRIEVLNFEESDLLKSPEIDFKNYKITFYLQNLTDTYYRKVIGLILSLIFYYLILKYIAIDKNYRRFYIVPFLALILLLVHVIFGVPSNNFQPETGDTLKTLYYSPFLIIAFAILISNYFQKNTLNKLKLFAYIPIFFLILGFPKSIDREIQIDINQINNYSFFCETNKVTILKSYIFENSDCKTGIVDSQPSLDFLNIENFNIKPKFKFSNTILAFLNFCSLVVLIFDTKLKKIFNIKNDK